MLSTIARQIAQPRHTLLLGVSVILIAVMTALAWSTPDLRAANIADNDATKPFFAPAPQTSGTWLYWTEGETPETAGIFRGKLADDGSLTGSIEQLHPKFPRNVPLHAPGSIALDIQATKMYWTDDGVTANTISRANLDGTGAEVLIWTGTNSRCLTNVELDNADPVGIALDMQAGKVYWIERTVGKICRSNLDGSGVETIIGPREIGFEANNGP